MQGDKNNKMVQTVCTLHDGLACRLWAHVEGGVIKKITPADFPDPGYKGVCAKGLNSHHWVHHKDRLRHPLKRVGERGEGKWERISWEEAIDGISKKLRELSEKYSPSSIAWSVAEFPLLKQAGYSRLISLTKGTSIDNMGFGDLSGPTADVLTFGRYVAYSWALRFKSPEYIIVWGANLADTEFRTMKKIMEAKKKGCEVVTVDPRYTATAARTDEHIPIRPGTDGALALSMIKVILDEGLADTKFLIEKTVGPFLVRSDNGLFLREGDITGNPEQKGYMVWDEKKHQACHVDSKGLKPSLYGHCSPSGIDCQPAFQLLADMVEPYTPEKASEITDVPAETIRRLAVSYASRKPANIYRGWGMQRTFYGDLCCRAINTLASVTGNINPERVSSFEDIMMPDGGSYDFIIPGGPLKTLPIMNLYDAITRKKPYPVKAFINANHNFVNQLPNYGKIITELLPELELIVVCDLFMSTTARYADYVLPVSSGFEHLDLVPRFMSEVPYMQLQEKVIDPLYESRSDFQITVELGRKMGFAEHFDKNEEQCLEEILDTHPTFKGITLEKLRNEPVLQKMPSGSPFNTPTGKIEFYVESLKQVGQELPVYLEPVESIRQEKAKKFSLSLLTPHHSLKVHSTLANVTELLNLGDPEPLLEMNPSDAGRRNIADRDIVSMFNDRGKVKLRVKITEKIKEGVVSVYQGWWPEHYMEGHHNNLTHDLINPVQNSIMGSNAALCDVLVEVRKAV